MAVGWDAEGEECILQLFAKTFPTEEIREQYPEYNVEAEAFITALKKPLGNDGTPLKDFKWKYGVGEYCDTFKKTRAAFGPSGLHMSHWKAATEQKRIARVHAFFIWAAFQFGFSYPHWEASWYCMIQKLEEPLYFKLHCNHSVVIAKKRKLNNNNVLITCTDDNRSSYSDSSISLLNKLLDKPQQQISEDNPTHIDGVNTSNENDCGLKQLKELMDHESELSSKLNDLDKMDLSLNGFTEDVTGLPVQIDVPNYDSTQSVTSTLSDTNISMQHVDIFRSRWT